jgi:glycosyltransferase involved in cell wall biosynthesis
MSYEPLLSIITVSAFDGERLAKTLKSLIGLPISVEHVVVIPDEDSESYTLWESFKDSGANRIILVRDQQRGIYQAMNAGAIVANGKYICFWNAGDMLNTHNDLRVLLDNLRETCPKWAICQGQFEWRDTKQELSHSNLAGFVTHEADTFVSHQTVIVERMTFEKIGMFNCRYRVAADTAQITQLLSICLPSWEDAVAVWVETPNFASRNHRRARFEVFLIALRYLVGNQKFKALRNIFKNEIRRVGTKWN